ncbi:RTX family toxin transporter [Yersinia intermedia]|jgi:ATP-binding cassette subfamily B protein RtxB|uniref:Alpha-hemolysin translocation ATP-binding protein HlyB n=1 Tax=Yersinia intermedia TaxID=631 RepID=A0ABX6F8Y1_YERIN|nr:type I secretion system permease/ATPase [Yersinia intermedia]QGR66330.1 type I secretion system permease/ATPase [Yersinia intermedia]QGR71345.1 type I secretion system permease/ATPase [Yersinia intermedia]CRY75003.1 RTX family toxin transporter [Yersinia intermedia]VDZ54998.1 RTX family toxin transporter [Yersinia intermedia]
MENHVHSSLVCAARLLRLAGLNSEAVEDFSRKAVIDRFTMATQASLQRYLSQFSRATVARFKVKKQSLNKIKPEYLPLAFRDMQGKFILLARINQKQVLLQHADSGKPEIISYQELASSWSGVIFCCSQSRFDIRWFVPVLLSHRKSLVQVLVLSMLLQFLALISPLFFQVIMDKVLVHNALTTLDVLIIVLLIVGIYEVVLKLLREYIFTHTTTRVDILLGGKLFKHLIKLPLGYFKQRHVGNIVARVRELDNIREFITGSALTLCVDVVFTFVLFIVMWCISPLLTFIVLGTLPLYLLLAALTTRPLQQKVEVLCGCAAHNGAFLTETVSGVETVKSLALEPQMYQRWETQTRDYADANFQVQNLQNLSSQAAQLLQKLAGAGVIVVGAYQVMSVQLSIGQLIAFNMLAVQALMPMSKLVDLWQQSIRAQVGLMLISDILSLPAEQSVGAPINRPLRGDISLQQVTFRYRADLNPVLHNFSLSLRAGEHIGLVGPSGSGKSTVARLLQCLYIAEQGVINIDGSPIGNFSPDYLRRQIGVVMQESYLFNRTVRENIAHSRPTASLSEVVEAACLAGANAFILALPLGYDTVLSEGGASLSGGQRQRIAIARTLLANPRILIFDEATSALDDESQAEVQKNMARIIANRTVITIAHRLSTVRHCHRIGVMEQGRITELANHEQLLALKGVYAQLWQQQADFSHEGSK